MRSIHIASCIIAFLMPIVLSCSHPDPDVNKYEVSELSLEEVSTGLPKVEIYTPDNMPITSKNEWIDGGRMTIYNADGSTDYQGAISIKGRGNSSWEFAKKPYALKLNRKSKILGMPKHKRWILLANWVDRTLMRNAIAFEIARQMPGLEYTPRGLFVELFLNGEHQGNYYLCEQIKIDANRVDILESDKDDTSDLAVTGGYLLEIDAPHYDYDYDEEYRFLSDRAKMPYQFKDPDEVSNAQYEYIRSFISDMEDALYDDEKFRQREFEKYIDLDSFVDWWFVHELTMNSEPRHPYSCFMYKDRDPDEKTVSKIKAGPVWDFDYNTFIPQYSTTYQTISCLYYLRLMEDGKFRQLVKQRWKALKERDFMEHVCKHIDQTEEKLQASDQLNARMYPITNTINGDSYLTFHDAVERLKQTFIRKFMWLDTEIEKL